MIAQLAAFWRARSARERWLISAAAVLVFAVLAPLWAHQAASSYRAAAASELAAARDLRADVSRLAAAGATQGAADLPGADGTLRGLALAAADSVGLSVARIEPAGPDRVRLAFAPAQSLQVYRWIDAVARRGAFVSRTTIARADEAGQVAAEFELAVSP